MTTNDENQQHVNQIANKLDKIACGALYKDTEGEEHDCSGMAEIPEDWEQESVYDYFEGSVYDFNFILDANRQYRAGRALVAFGGPTIWVDTERESVDLYWWGNEAHAPLSRNATNALDDALEELFNA